MNELLLQIKDRAAQIQPMLVEIRHHLHSHPELSYQEFETSKFIQGKLKEWGLPVQVMAQTGVVSLIEGRNPSSRIIALRADIDALPITEQNDVDYKSQNVGVMHACGHDVHTTSLLGAAYILNELKDAFEGTVKLIFQPGEERNPGGASIMITEGVLENPAPQAIVALHAHPGLSVGKLSFRGGQVMASADEIYITIKGNGGHAASPHLTQDTILIASELIVSLQQIISRNNNPFSPSVLSICSFQGGYTTNVIPSEVKLMGTFRAMDETWRYKAHELIKHHTKTLVNALGAQVDIHIDVGYPSVNNNVQLNANAVDVSKALMGNDNVEQTEMRMGAEDFGYYAQQIPGCFFRLGVRNEDKGIIHNVHTPLFDIDESALATGAANMAAMGAMLNVKL